MFSHNWYSVHKKRQYQCFCRAKNITTTPIEIKIQNIFLILLTIIIIPYHKLLSFFSTQTIPTTNILSTITLSPQLTFVILLITNLAILNIIQKACTAKNTLLSSALLIQYSIWQLSYRPQSMNSPTPS